MRRFSIVFTLVGGAFAVPADAQNKPAAFDPSLGIAITSDYRFRGISQSNRRPAIQATASVSHKSGLYVGSWGSTIGDYVAAGADVEVDLYGGYKTTTAGGTTIDGGLLFYLYPDTPGVRTNFFEPYFNVARTFGRVTTKLGTNVAWKQRELGLTGEKRAGLYVYGDVSAALPNTPLSLTGHIGHSFRRNLISGGTHDNDWSLSAGYTAGPATFSLGYVGTDRSLPSYPAGGGRNRDIGKAAVVASVALGF